MSKYKICKFVDGNGRESYQILKKGWLFWCYMRSYTGVGPIKTIDKFSNIEQAQKHINYDMQYIKQKIVKKVECFDYVP